MNLSLEEIKEDFRKAEECVPRQACYMWPDTAYPSKAGGPLQNLRGRFTVNIKRKKSGVACPNVTRCTKKNNGKKTLNNPNSYKAARLFPNK